MQLGLVYKIILACSLSCKGSACLICKFWHTHIWSLCHGFNSPWINWIVTQQKQTNKQTNLRTNLLKYVTIKNGWSLCGKALMLICLAYLNSKQFWETLFNTYQSETSTFYIVYISPQPLSGPFIWFHLSQTSSQVNLAKLTFHLFLCRIQPIVSCGLRSCLGGKTTREGKLSHLSRYI